MSTTPQPSGPRVAGLGERLRTYLIGVGIGLMLLGMFWMMKHRAAQQQAPTSATTPNGVPSTPGAPPSGN